MVRRNALLSAAALGASAALLAACGNSASQPPAALPVTHPAASPSPTPSPSPDASASIPADLTINFEPPTTTDPKLLAVTADAKAMVYAFEEALAKGTPNDPLLQSLVTQQAGVQITELILQFNASKTRPSGTVTFFRVTPSQSGGFYGVGFCEDDTKAIPVTVQGDTPKGSAPTGPNAMREWLVGFSQDKTGKFVIDHLSTQTGVKACT